MLVSGRDGEEIVSPPYKLSTMAEEFKALLDHHMVGFEISVDRPFNQDGLVARIRDPILQVFRTITISGRELHANRVNLLKDKVNQAKESMEQCGALPVSGPYPALLKAKLLHKMRYAFNEYCAEFEQPPVEIHLPPEMYESFEELMEPHIVNLGQKTAMFKGVPVHRDFHIGTMVMKPTKEELPV